MTVNYQKPLRLIANISVDYRLLMLGRSLERKKERKKKKKSVINCSGVIFRSGRPQRSNSDGEREKERERERENERKNVLLTSVME